MHPNVRDFRNLAQPDLYLRITQLEAQLSEDSPDEQVADLAINCAAPDDEFIDATEITCDLESLRLRASW